MEKRKLLFVFLKQFLIVYKNWEPVDSGQFLDTASSAAPTGEYSSRFDDIVVGCSAGHPAEIILVLTEEVGQLTALVTECKLALINCFVDIMFLVNDGTKNFCLSC